MLLVLLSAAADPAALGPDLGRYALVCGLLLIAVIGLGVGFRRLFARSLRARALRRSLQVLDVLQLGRGKRLLVVRCYDRVFLVGQGEKELSHIAELDRDEAGTGSGATIPAVEPAPVPPMPPSFRAELERVAAPAPSRAREPRRRPVLENGRGILG